MGAYEPEFSPPIFLNEGRLPENLMLFSSKDSRSDKQLMVLGSVPETLLLDNVKLCRLGTLSKKVDRDPEINLSAKSRVRRVDALASTAPAMVPRILHLSKSKWTI